MAVHGCTGYTSGCRCPRCARRRADRRYQDRSANQSPQARPRGKTRRNTTGAAVAGRITPEHSDDSTPGDGVPSWPVAPTPLAALAPATSTADVITQLCGQITSLRQIAAAHSPGQPSFQLHHHQAGQLVALLERHRDQLRDFLNNGPIDTTTGEGGDTVDDIGADAGTWRTA